MAICNVGDHLECRFFAIVCSTLVKFFNHVLPAGNDNFRSRETDDVANLPVLRVSTKVAESKHMHLQPETDTLTPPNEVST